MKPAMQKAISILAFSFSLNAVAHYVQVGDSYSKQNYKYVYGQEAVIDNLIDNTVLINSKRDSGVNRGTGFYIGKQNGKHLFVTNAHVMNKNECAGASISFLNHNFRRSKGLCKEVIFSHYTKENSDITVFSVDDYYADMMRGSGLTIDWDFTPVAGMMLAFAGFGLKQAPRGRASNVERGLRNFTMLTSFDADCVVATESTMLYHLSSVSTKHVFGTGCDAASGDSGSAVIDRASGEVVGLLFGSTNNYSWMPSSNFWNLVGTDSPQLWSYGSFAISLTKLKEVFKSYGIK
ncbi:MAG: trypsin-like peptidase domain-containing protein [Bacteriovoracaceae bacterium]|nr:trypsin-like peptidase domain-containing protein [Bacteriovoracaceae bacterium]